MRNWLFRVTPLVLVGILGAVWYWNRGTGVHDDVAREIGGSSAVRTLLHADRVEAFRLGKLPRELERSQLDHLAEHPIIGGPVEVLGERASEAAAALTRYESYDWEHKKACIPEYGVRMSFHRGRDRVDVYFCFECDILVFVHNDKTTGGGNFDFISGQLVRMVKPLFPSDPAIQKLRERSTPTQRSAMPTVSTSL